MTAYRAPLPQPTPETQPFFDGLRRRKLLIQRCNDCGVAYYYPRPFCPDCLSANVAWEEATGKGTLYSFVINYRSPPGFEAPYVIAVVGLEEGPRLCRRSARALLRHRITAWALRHSHGRLGAALWRRLGSTVIPSADFKANRLRHDAHSQNPIWRAGSSISRPPMMMRASRCSCRRFR